MDSWWKNTVFYEIYMPSFCDSDGDGTGDFPGITSRLPYLKELGVGGIWLTPFYPSPKADNGYDVSDYYGVDPGCGTMEDFEEMVAKAHGLGIRVIADMVVNHTSSLHPWFIESASSKDSPKRDWYIWRDPVNDRPPNNWESFFGGSAWEMDDKSGQYYYHSFAKEQVDLNWCNPQVEEAVYKVLDFWLEKGIDGFRFDVINNLTVFGGLYDNPLDEKGKQLHAFDVNQPGIHEVVLRICKRVREKNPEAFLVGEISSDELEVIHSYTAGGGLDTTFNFNLGSRNTFRYYEVYRELKRMIRLYGTKENPTLFFGSHDMGRFPTRFGFTDRQIKCLLTLMLTFKGIPFLYYGDEIGMRSRILESVEDACDIQGIMAYEAALKQGKSHDEAVRILNEKSRDASRGPMDWKTADWQRENAFSVWNYVRNLIAVRTSRPEFTKGGIFLGEAMYVAVETGRALGPGRKTVETGHALGTGRETMETGRALEPGREAVEDYRGIMELERTFGEKKTGVFMNFSDVDVSLMLKERAEMILASEKEVRCFRGFKLLLPGGSAAILEYKDEVI